MVEDNKKEKNGEKEKDESHTGAIVAGAATVGGTAGALGGTAAVGSVIGVTSVGPVAGGLLATAQAGGAVTAGSTWATL